MAAETFFIIILICFITLSITRSYDINNRFLNVIDHEQAELLFNKTVITSSFSKIGRCIGVQAMEELGCTFATRIFQSACVRHQLCYACGFVHRIKARKCNKLAYMNMYQSCSNHSLSLSSKTNCLKKRFSALNLLQQQVYRSANENHAFSFECHQRCVYDYLYAN